MKCVICKINDAKQKHHVSYEPELVIDLYKPCHQLIHSDHGVGNGAGEYKKQKIKESHPLFTYTEWDTEKENCIVKDSETDEALNQLVCKCGSVNFELFGRVNQTAAYARCKQCSYDIHITTVTHKQLEQTGNPSQQTLDTLNIAEKHTKV